MTAAATCLAVAAVLGCGGKTQAPPPLPALGSLTTVLRLPVEGGTAVAYSPDGIKPLGWQSSGGIPALERPLGYDLDERIVYLLDVKDRLIGLDLESGRGRPYLTGVRAATVGPEGAVYVVDSAGRVLRMLRRVKATFPAHYPKPPAALFGASNGQLVTVGAGSPRAAQLLSTDRTGTSTPVGSGPVTATFWGELLAFGDGDRVRLVRPADGSPAWDAGTSKPPSALLFSPSGHRLYALDDDRVRVFDRFTGDRISTIDLPGPGKELREDGSGRWMLVRPGTGDSAWVIDLATARLTATVATAWRGDLPLVAGAGTLLALSGTDVLGYDLSLAPPKQLTRVAGGGPDLWMALPWVPPRRASLAIAAAESVSAVQDSGLVGDSAGPAPEIWLQVSSSQNPDWAEDLARQLANSGVQTAVWKPTTPEEGYRVVVGPFRSRDEAEDAGKRLGRPYFTVTPPPKAP